MRSIKRYFQTSFSRLPFSFNDVVLEVFLKLSDLLKPAFEKSSKKNVNKFGKNNQIISAHRFEVFA